MKAAGRIVSAAALMTAAGIFRQLSFFVATVLFAQKMAPEQFGIASLWYAAVLIFIGIGDWGVRFSGWSAVASRGLDNLTVSRCLYAKGVTATVTAIFLFAVLPVFSPHGVDPLLIGIVLVLLFVNQLTLEWIFRGLSMFRDVLIMSALTGIVMLVAALVVSPGARAEHYLGAVLVSNIVAVAWGGLLLARRGLRLEPEAPREVFAQIRGSSRLAVLSVVNRSYAQLPILFVGLVATTAIVADFRISHMLFMFASTFSYYAVAAVYARFSSGEYARPELVRIIRLLAIAVALMLPAAYIGAQFVAPWIIDVAFGPEYASALPMLQVTMCVLPVGFVGMFVREFAPALGLDRLLLNASLVAIACGAIALYLLARVATPATFPIALGITECIIILPFLCAVLARRGRPDPA